MTHLETRYYASESDPNVRYKVDIYHDTDVDSPVEEWSDIRLGVLKSCYGSTYKYDRNTFEGAGTYDLIAERFGHLLIDELAELLNRFMRITGQPYRYYGQTTHGYSQSDWVDVLVETDNPDIVDRLPSYVDELSIWARGDVFGVTVTEQVNDDKYRDWQEPTAGICASLGGIYADSYDEVVTYFMDGYAPVEIAGDIADLDKYERD